MYKGLQVAVVIPALNEEKAIGKVVTNLLQLTYSDYQVIDQVVVCDNGSTDHTSGEAKKAGAKVVYQYQPGYGLACLTAIEALPSCDIVLFVDGDDSCFAEDALLLLEGIYQGDDLSIGSRVLGTMQRGSLTLPQQFGNWLAALLIKLLWGEKVTDLGPFRAIRKQALNRIGMQDEAFGWTVEMQIKAAQLAMTTSEYPVDSKVRIGKSKISGTLMGTIGAAHGILGTIFKLRWQQTAYLAAVASSKGTKA